MSDRPNRSTTALHTLLEDLFRHHGVECAQWGGWVVFPGHGGMRVQGETSGERMQAAGHATQLDIRFDLGGGRVIVESFTGAGDTAERARDSAVDGFVRGSFPVLRAAFLAPPDERVTEERWIIAGTGRRVTIGNVTVKGTPPAAGASPRSWFPHLQSGVSAARPDPGVHWVRFSYTHAGDRALECEVLVDNQPAPEIAERMSSFN